jgi:flagellar protein FlgJ
MQSSPLSSVTANPYARTAYATASAINGRKDPVLADALTRVSPEMQKKARAQAQDFEAMFLNSMFSQMTTGLKGDGPFGDTTGTGIWRSQLTQEYSKAFARSGGVGISNDVFRTLILQQARRAG